MATGFTPRLQQLLSALRCLPGVGPKSAQRMAFYLLDRDPDGATTLASALQSAVAEIGRCDRCRMFSEEPLCGICTDRRRDGRVVCVVETPADVIAIEESAAFNGRYFVLMGRLSPLDGIGPEELGLAGLEKALEAEGAEELILATSATVEGEATAAYIASLASRRGIGATRIAHGVPMGGELEYVDSGTLSLALQARTRMAAD